MTSDDAGPILAGGGPRQPTHEFFALVIVLPQSISKPGIVAAARPMLPASGPKLLHGSCSSRELLAPLSVLGGNDAGEPKGYRPARGRCGGRAIFAAIRAWCAPLRRSPGRAL